MKAVFAGKANVCHGQRAAKRFGAIAAGAFLVMAAACSGGGDGAANLATADVPKVTSNTPGSDEGTNHAGDVKKPVEDVEAPKSLEEVLNALRDFIRKNGTNKNPDK